MGYSLFFFFLWIGVERNDMIKTNWTERTETRKEQKLSGTAKTELVQELLDL